jgi:hypothetical protein
MMHPQKSFGPLAIAFACLLGACGGDASEEADQAEVPQEEGLVLDSTDFVGIEAENVSFNLHWVQGPVNREPSRLAPPVNEIQEITTVEGAEFDRVIFHLANPEAEVPGYALAWSDTTVVNCQTNEPVSIVGDQKLRVRITAASIQPPALRPQDPRYENLQALASTCPREGVLEWHFGVREQAQIRVIEMRAPRRLVVDVRHDPPGRE